MPSYAQFGSWVRCCGVQLGHGEVLEEEGTSAGPAGLAPGP